MDIFASLTQSAGLRSDGNTDALAAQEWIATALDGEEFADLAEILSKLTDGLSPEEKLETDDQDALLANADILTAILDKMTGITAAVAAPKETSLGDVEEIVKALLAGAAKQTEAPVPPENVEEVDPGQALLPDSVPDGEVENPIVEPSEDGMALSKAESSITEKSLDPQKKPLEASRKGQILQMPAAHVSKPVASVPEGREPEVKHSMAEDALMGLQPNKTADDVANKPPMTLVTEPRSTAIPIAPVEVATPDAPRAQAEIRQVQFNPTAVTRQITDTVVTMRDEMVEIRLSPEELGRVRMVLTGHDRAPHLTIWVDRPDVLDQMRKQGDNLLQQLREQGMSGASLDFRDGRPTRDDTTQDQNFREEQGGHPKDRPLMVLPEASGRSLVTPLLSGRHGINIKV